MNENEKFFFQHINNGYPLNRWIIITSKEGIRTTLLAQRKEVTERGKHYGPKQQRIHTGPLALPFNRLPAPLTHSLAPPYLLRSCALLRALVRLLARFTYYRAIFSVFFLSFGPQWKGDKIKKDEDIVKKKVVMIQEIRFL